jgi:hypothetical protein
MIISPAAMYVVQAVMAPAENSGMSRNGTGSQPRFLKITAPMRAACVCSAALTGAPGLGEVRVWSGEGKRRGAVAARLLGVRATQHSP